jgi:hypothetical protein
LNINASDVAAAAAVAAAVVSLINVGYTSYLSRKKEYSAWAREMLPELITRFKDAAARYDAATRDVDWENVDPSVFPGQPEFRDMMEIRDSLEVFASQRTVDAAYELIVRTDFLRIGRAENSNAAADPPQWDMESAEKFYRLAYENFLRAARSEMGLRPITTSPPRRRRLI